MKHLQFVIGVDGLISRFISADSIFVLQKPSMHEYGSVQRTRAYLAKSTTKYLLLLRTTMQHNKE